MNAGRDGANNCMASKSLAWKRANVGDLPRSRFIAIANHEARMGNYVERIKRNIKMNDPNFARADGTISLTKARYRFSFRGHFLKAHYSTTSRRCTRRNASFKLNMRFNRAVILFPFLLNFHGHVCARLVRTPS